MLFGMLRFYFNRLPLGNQLNVSFMRVCMCMVIYRHELYLLTEHNNVVESHINTTTKVYVL